MIDLHCHILPHVDDGPADMEEAVALGRALIEDGVDIAVATPHGAGLLRPGAEAEIREQLAGVQMELARRGLALSLLAGLEVLLTPETPALCREGSALTLNSGRYLLVELPPSMVPPFAGEMLFQLQLMGLVPVIAHPERNLEIASNPGLLRGMVDRGMLVQVTAGSLVGAYGTTVRKAAEALLKRGLAHVIASDAHSAAERPPLIRAGVRRAEELLGEEAALAMVTSTPEAILDGRDVLPQEPRPSPRRSWHLLHLRK